jgi:hypothetical protein
LKRFSIEFNGEEMGTPWIGMDQTMMARFLFFITLALLPEMAILVLGKSQIRGLLSPHRAYDEAAIVELAAAFLGSVVVAALSWSKRPQVREVGCARELFE